MQQQTRPKTKLMTLTQKTSAKGTVYLFGWLGDAEVIAFQGDDSQWGPQWHVFVQEKAPKPQAHAQGHGQQRPTQREQSVADLFQRPLNRDRG
jgi:hypothetical protein